MWRTILVVSCCNSPHPPVGRVVAHTFTLLSIQVPDTEGTVLAAGDKLVPCRVHVNGCDWPRVALEGVEDDVVMKGIVPHCSVLGASE